MRASSFDRLSADVAFLVHEYIGFDDGVNEMLIPDVEGCPVRLVAEERYRKSVAATCNSFITQCFGRHYYAISLGPHFNRENLIGVIEAMGGTAHPRSVIEYDLDDLAIMFNYVDDILDGYAWRAKTYTFKNYKRLFTPRWSRTRHQGDSARALLWDGLDLARSNASILRDRMHFDDCIDQYMYFQPFSVEDVVEMDMEMDMFLNREGAVEDEEGTDMDVGTDSDSDIDSIPEIDD